MTKRTNTETRKATLELAGKGNFLSLELPEGLAPGSKIHLVIDENGQLVLNGEGDLAGQIMEDGYVKNTRLHRRWVMAQMFHALNYKHWDYNHVRSWEKDKHAGYNAYVNLRLSFDYCFTMMADEVKVLSKLETRDQKCFKEREHFFNKQVVIDTCMDYMDELRKYVNTLPTPKCNGVPYKRIRGKENIYVYELDKKLYNPLSTIIIKMNRARNYAELHKLLLEFNRAKVKLNWDTRKSPAWKDAYKGNGAYYTLKNLVMYHNCYIFPEYGTPVTGFKAVQYLEDHLTKYKGEGWRYFALLKKVIADNNFDYEKRMKDLGVRR